MRSPDRELRDEALSRALKSAMAGAPEPWIREALRVPRTTPAPAPAPVRSGSRLRLLVPHLAGLALLLGLAVALFLRPEVGEAGWSVLRDVVSDSLPLTLEGLAESLQGLGAAQLAAMASTPVLIILLYQGFNGFPILHRHR